MTRRLALSLAAALLAACSTGDAAAKRSATPSVVAQNPAPSAPAAAPAATPAATPAANASVKRDSLIEAADRGRVLGSEKAGTWLVIISDFQCPYCRQWHVESFAAIKKEYVDTGKLRVAYLNFPLSMHPNAMPAAHASMCASAQGKFWETEAKIFDSQKQWEKLPDARAFFDSVAIATGVNAAQQHACTQTQHMASLIDADRQRGESAGVQSTPTFFVGQRQVLGAIPISEFRRVIDSVLAASGKR